MRSLCHFANGPWAGQTKPDSLDPPPPYIHFKQPKDRRIEPDERLVYLEVEEFRYDRVGFDRQTQMWVYRIR